MVEQNPSLPCPISPSDLIVSPLFLWPYRPQPHDFCGEKTHEDHTLGSSFLHLFVAQIYAESSWIFHPDPSGSKPLEKRPRHWEQSLQEFTVPVACGLLCFLLCFLRMDNWGLRQPLVYVSNKSRWTPQRFLSKVMDRFVSIEPGPEFSANRFGICSWNLQDSVTDAEWCLIVYNLPTKVAQAFKSLPSPDHGASPKITQMFEVHKVHVNWNLAAYRPIRPRTSQISPMLPMCFYFLGDCLSLLLVKAIATYLNFICYFCSIFLGVASRAS